MSHKLARKSVVCYGIAKILKKEINIWKNTAAQLFRWWLLEEPRKHSIQHAFKEDYLIFDFLNLFSFGLFWHELAIYIF